MGEVSTAEIDLAKSVFQVHGSDSSGTVIFRKELRRDGLVPRQHSSVKERLERTTR